MRRREFITLLGGTAAWPLTARAQQQKLPIIGFLSSLSPEGRVELYTAAFLKGLSETGFIDGRNVVIEYRWARGRYELLSSLAAELVQHKVAVIAAVAGSDPGLAAKAATATIPIVFQTGSDPIKDGLVSTLNHPGGNVTGVTRLATTIEPKRLELLHELVPGAAVITFLVNPNNPAADNQMQEMNDAARSLGLQLNVAKASTEHEVDAAFAALSHGASAVLVATDPFLGSHGLILLAKKYAIPVCYFDRTQVAAGGLMAYGASLTESWRQVGGYTGRILKGEKPSEMPILQPTKFELSINLSTAKTLGLAVPDKLLALSDEVIE